MGADVDCGAHVSLTGTGSSATRQCSSLSSMRRCGLPLASLACVAARSGAEGESARFLQSMTVWRGARFEPFTKSILHLETWIPLPFSGTARRWECATRPSYASKRSLKEGLGISTSDVTRLT